MAPEIAEEMNSFCRFCSTKQDSATFEHQSRKSLHGKYYNTWENRCFAYIAASDCTFYLAMV